jgi:ABC-type transporter MlaC component
MYTFGDYLDLEKISEEREIENLEVNISETTDSDELAELYGKKIDKIYKTETEKRYGNNLEKYSDAQIIINQFVEYINTNDYINAYRMINKSFCERMDYTIEKFEKEFSFDTPRGFHINAFEVLNEKVFISVNMFDYNLDFETNISADEYSEDIRDINLLIDTNNKVTLNADIDSEKFALKDSSAEEIYITGLDVFFWRYDITIDDIEKISNNLKLSVSLIETINNDIIKYDNKLEEYFSLNQDIFLDVYGIFRFSTFNEFTKDISKVENIKYCKISNKGILSLGNTIIIPLVIEMENSETVVLNFKIVKEKFIDETKLYLYYSPGGENIDDIP